MAEKKRMDDQEDLDLDAAKPPTSGKKKLILLVSGMVLLMAISVGVTVLLIGGGDKGGVEMNGAGQVDEKLMTKPLYLPLDKITVNLSQKGGAKFLQVEMHLMSFDQKVLDAVVVHMPVIRNDMLVLLASQPVENLASLEGKELLRQEIIDKVHTVIKQQADLDGGIEAVYFTRFIMQ